MTRTVAVLGMAAAVMLASSAGAQQSCPLSANGSILVTGPTQTGRLTPSGVPDSCLATGSCVAQGAQPINFNVHTLVNNNTVDPTCVTATLTALCGVPGVTELYLAAYSPTFNPSNLCQNYLGASGHTAVNSQVSASFRVPAGAQFQVVVSLISPGTQCEYKLTVAGCGLGDPQPPAPVPALSPAALAALIAGLAACAWWRLRRAAPN